MHFIHDNIPPACCNNALANYERSQMDEIIFATAALAVALIRYFSHQE